MHIWQNDWWWTSCDSGNEKCVERYARFLLNALFHSVCTTDKERIMSKKTNRHRQ